MITNQKPYLQKKSQPNEKEIQYGTRLSNAAYVISIKYH